MNDVAENVEVEGEATEEKTVKVPANIVRGRMPAAMVYAIRFLEDGSDGELAKKYVTTNGKISDIKKNRNFGYITEDVKFPQEEIDKAIERAGKLGEYEDDVMATLKDVPVGSDEEAAKLEEQRKAARKPRGSAKAKDETKSDESDSDESEEEEVNIDDLID